MQLALVMSVINTNTDQITENVGRSLEETVLATELWTSGCQSCARMVLDIMGEPRAVEGQFSEICLQESPAAGALLWQGAFKVILWTFNMYWSNLRCRLKPMQKMLLGCSSASLRMAHFCLA